MALQAERSGHYYRGLTACHAMYIIPKPEMPGTFGWCQALCRLIFPFPDGILIQDRLQNFKLSWINDHIIACFDAHII